MSYDDGLSWVVLAAGLRTAMVNQVEQKRFPPGITCFRQLGLFLFKGTRAQGSPASPTLPCGVRRWLSWRCKLPP